MKHSHLNLLVIVILWVILWVLPQAVMAQAAAGPETSPVGVAPETSPVGVVPEDSPVGVLPEASDSSRITLKLATGNCNVNNVESTLLRMKGVTGVDIESRKGYLVVDYVSNALTLQRIIDEVARKRGCATQSVPNASLSAN